MRFAVLSDIHGNFWALSAVLEDAKYRGITQFINLGDILYGPLKPLETYNLLKSIDAVTIQGNEDRDVYEFYPNRDGTHPTLTYMLEELGSEPVEWLRSLPTTTVVAEEIFACHGIPTNDLVYLLEDVSSGFPIVRDEAAILHYLEGVNQPIVLCGHSHVARVVQLSSGQLIINPGSVGVPAYDDDAPNYHAMQNYSPFASYAVLEKQNETWQVELLKIPYDVHLAVEQAQRQGREDWAFWIETGRVAAA
ncbi:metallophosphoesterase family protein [Microcoleus sp. FACHB-1515]|uniref:metallophosphoesterase family protein n=1 Tax=Cyanophyceae TaxID=3028117 RepID=UPI001681D6BF|nr:metallophosphoesterase family protein [Microcoleus sp. FACHB-1515]MBD2091621.1 metallophosphoesterase family protein [Microcoleus sp. FACHB-1515]